MSGVYIDDEVRIVLNHMGWRKSFDAILCAIRVFGNVVGPIKVEMQEDPEDQCAASSLVVEAHMKYDRSERRDIRKKIHVLVRKLLPDLAIMFVLLQGELPSNGENNE